MHRPGLMAPPDLYEQRPSAGLMRPGASAAGPVDLRLFLWALAAALAAVEVVLELVVD